MKISDLEFAFTYSTDSFTRFIEAIQSLTDELNRLNQRWRREQEERIHRNVFFGCLVMMAVVPIVAWLVFI